MLCVPVVRVATSDACLDVVVVVLVVALVDAVEIRLAVPVAIAGVFVVPFSTIVLSDEVTTAVPLVVVTVAVGVGVRSSLGDGS